MKDLHPAIPVAGKRGLNSRAGEVKRFAVLGGQSAREVLRKFFGGIGEGTSGRDRKGTGGYEESGGFAQGEAQRLTKVLGKSE